MSIITFVSTRVCARTVRTNDDVDEGEGRLRLPDPTDNPDSWMQDTIEENLDESYGILRDDDAGSSEEE